MFWDMTHTFLISRSIVALYGHDYTHDRIKINASSRRVILPGPLDHVHGWQVAERRLSSMMNPVINLIFVRAFDRHWASELLAVPNVEVASSLPFVEHAG
jgi:hypothetical protein